MRAIFIEKTIEYKRVNKWKKPIRGERAKYLEKPIIEKLATISQQPIEFE